MENEKPESVLDICQKIRDAGIPDLADHLEAAWKREKAEIETDALAVGGVVEAARHRPGNAAAMKEALTKIHDLTNALDEECAVDPVEIRDIARAALSAPARNCDLYDNKTDAELGFVGETGEDDRNPLYWQLFANWLFAPAAERKGEGDGR